MTAFYGGSFSTSRQYGSVDAKIEVHVGRKARGECFINFLTLLKGVEGYV